MCIGLTLLLVALPCGFAQDAVQDAEHEEPLAWYAPLFFHAALHYFFTPELFSEQVQSRPGFRVGLGYDLGQFSFGQLSAGLETGFTSMAGLDPQVQGVRLLPVLLRLSYLPPLKLYGELGLRADLGAGLVFGGAEYYKNRMTLWTGNDVSSSERNLLAEARLYLTHPLPANFGVYLGGGVDLLFESDSNIALPVIQAGLTFRPFTRSRRRPPPVIIALPEPEPEPEPEPAPVWALSGVYFAPNSMVMMDRYLPNLALAGQYLTDYPVMRITLRGYAALFGSAAGRQMVSEARAQYVKDYLVREYGISEDRIIVEFFGADREPALADGTWETYRAVEIIIGANEGTFEETNEQRSER